VRLIGEFGAEPQRERAARRLEAFAAAEATRRLSALKHLKEAIEDGRLRGLARGLAYQLVEQCGVLDRRGAEQRIRLLSRNERRTLKALGVRFGAFSLYLPSLLEPQAQLLAFAYAELASASWRPDSMGLNPLPHPPPRPQALALRGLRVIGQFAAPIAELERLDALARAAWPEGSGAIDVTDALLADLRWPRDDAHHILRALGFARVREGEGAERAVFRRRSAPDQSAPRPVPVATPFAALAALSKPNAAAARRARRAKARLRRAVGRPAS
jgi:ATP-dependent RNA helicase SUPV3L1/SUV3